jgi:iron complex outermembrane receptor protein
VGLFGTQCESLFPRWRQTLRVNWATPWNVTLSATWRYMGGVKLETDTNEPTIGRGTVDRFNHTLPQRSYLDLAALWHVNDRISFRAGVNNVLDQDPPLVNNRLSGTGSPNTYPSYDLLGRKLFMGLTANF